MFKRSRRRIVAAIMSVLALLWVGTLGVIYGSSYFEMAKQNREMLRAHSQMYTLPNALHEMLPPDKPRPEEHSFASGFDPQSPMFQLSNFYTVAISYEGEVLEIRNEHPALHTDSALETLARSILKGKQASGTKDNLVYCKTDKGGYILVVFMDNTLINESARTLLRYTAVFGSVALVLFFFLSRYLAKKIVAPLEESYQKQKQFISDAGHELKTPVSVVSANAELLARQLGSNQWLANIQYENERMGELVGQLLELARTESVKPQLEALDLSRLVAGGVLPFESVAYENGLRLETQIAPGITAQGNSSQLSQLVSILVDNAIGHSKRGGKIQVSLTQTRSGAVFSVINEAEPIPPEQIPQLFDRFYRTEDARTGGDGHYGLGLAIAKAITQTHQGKIDVTCYDGKVCFSVRLPKG